MTEIGDRINKHRRGLLIISVTLIVYILAGGKIDTISATAGTVKLSKPWVADIFAWLIYFYFLWCCRGLFMIGQFKAELLDSVLRNSDFITFIRKKIEADKPREDPYDRNRVANLLDHQVLKGNYMRKLFKRELDAHKIEIPYLWMIGIESKTAINNIYTKESFRESVFPLIVAITALFLGVLKYCFGTL